jgi:hypothetical protein
MGRSHSSWTPNGNVNLERNSDKMGGPMKGVAAARRKKLAVVRIRKRLRRESSSGETAMTNEERLLRHSAWATRVLLERCRSLTPEQFHR